MININKIEELKNEYIKILKQDYEIAKKRGLKYWYESYEDYINKANQINTNEKSNDLAMVFKDSFDFIFKNYEFDGSYKQATLRINLLALDIDAILRYQEKLNKEGEISVNSN